MNDLPHRLDLTIEVPPELLDRMLGLMQTTMRKVFIEAENFAITANLDVTPVLMSDAELVKDAIADLDSGASEGPKPPSVRESEESIRARVNRYDRDFMPCLSEKARVAAVKESEDRESASPTDEITNLAELLPDRWYAVTEDGRVFGGYTKRKYALGRKHSTTVLGSSVRELLDGMKSRAGLATETKGGGYVTTTQYQPDLFYAIVGSEQVDRVPFVYGGFASAKLARSAVPSATRVLGGEQTEALIQSRRGA